MRQGLFGIFEVFADTIVICTLTALVILLSGVPVSYGPGRGRGADHQRLCGHVRQLVTIFTAVAMCCFAFSTIIGWGSTARAAWNFCSPRGPIAPFMVVYSLVAILAQQRTWAFYGASRRPSTA